MERHEEEREFSSNIYRFIDQAYSWALECMKFVTRLKIEECQTIEACRETIKAFDDYMLNHPPIAQEDFHKVSDMCRRHENSKCLRQCNFAQQKCSETLNLFNKRRQLLEKIKVQLKAQNKKRISGSTRFKNKAKEYFSSSEPQKIEKTSKIIGGFNRPWENRKSSTNSVSTASIDSSSESALSVSRSSSPNCLVNLNGKSRSPKPSLKPARKVMKKSTTSPGDSSTQQQVASHVHSQSGGTIAIGSPVQIQEKDDTTGKMKFALIIDELIATEKEYVRSLDYIIENYFPEMCRLDIPQTLRCKRNIIFGNIEKIAEFHSCYFLRDLQNCNGNPMLIANTFQLHKESFGLYALYSKNKPQSDQLLQEHGNDFFKARQAELGDKMNLASYLLKPVQRMGKYALMLHAMSKHCSSEEERRSLRDAEELVKFQLRHGNDLLTMDSIRDCDVNLKEQGNLLRQEEFMIFFGRRKCVRRVFLFEDLILFGKPIRINGGHDVYQYKCSYKTAEIGLTENIGESGHKFEIWFRRRRQQATQDRFILQSTTRAIKRLWVEEITSLLWKQAIQNKDHRQVELSSMGVGRKPHLDLTNLSENSITDRSVFMLPISNESLLSDRFAKSRTRASVAITNFDHCNQENKRPHSLISTSSSSSSVGSGNFQSVSLFSSLHLASLPPKAAAKPNGFLTPIAYCDFRAIVEDRNEETGSACNSTISTSRGESPDSQNDSLISRQFVATPNILPAIH